MTIERMCPRCENSMVVVVFLMKVNKFLSVVERELDESLKKLPKALDDDEGLEVCYRIIHIHMSVYIHIFPCLDPWLT